MASTGSTEDVFNVGLDAPLDGELTSNETLKEPSREVIVRVDLFTVVVTFAVLLTLISVGTVANVAVLVVLKYRKRVQATVRRDAILCNMSVVHLLICLVLAPIEFATVAESFVKHSLPGYVCLARDCGFHLLIGTLVTAVVLLALCQAQRQNSGANRTASRWAEALPVLQLIVPWIVGACAAATSVSTRLFTSLGFEVCRKSIAFWERVRGEGPDPWQLDLVLGPVYFVALCGALLGLVVVVGRRRKKNFEEEVENEKQEGECLPSAAKESRKMKPIKDGGDGVQLVNRTSGLKDPSPSPSTNPGGKVSSQVTASDNQKPPDSQENEDGEETDDIFDLKMRTEFENKSRSSGRRHTVANIGLPDLAELRSASSPDRGAGSHHRSQTRHPSSSSSSKKAPEYHYVRKWSVDITALANQLENPKAHSDTSPFKERGDDENGYEEALKGLRAPSNACIVASCEYIGPPAAGVTEKSPGPAGDGPRKGSGKGRPSTRNGFDGGKETAGPRELPGTSVRSGIEEKGIVAKDASTCQEIETSRNSGTKEPSIGCADEHEEEEEVPAADAVSTIRPGPSRDAERHPRDAAKTARELATLTKMTALVAASLLLACPSVVLFVWFSVAPMHDLHLGYNLAVSSEMIVMLQAALNPVLLLLWVDQRLRRRARRLLAEASHLRCVCYCNVGRQGNCLRPQKASVASRQRTADEKAPLKA